MIVGLGDYMGGELCVEGKTIYDDDDDDDDGIMLSIVMIVVLVWC